ncbi:MAG: HINT domain-containing protein [Planctomycetaceae bacterium]|nr:HINT domain-containing protein [Planctomycetaceae bacterium]
MLGADGTVETITGTTIHPVWSVDRQEWVPLAELADGETLQGLDGLAVVLSVSLSRVSQPVYNIEVHGEHVYQVGELGVVVHNVKGGLVPTGATRLGKWGEDRLEALLGGAGIKPKNPFFTSMGTRYFDRLIN